MSAESSAGVTYFACIVLGAHVLLVIIEFGAWICTKRNVFRMHCFFNFIWSIDGVAMGCVSDAWSVMFRNVLFVFRGPKTTFRASFRFDFLGMLALQNYRENHNTKFVH